MRDCRRIRGSVSLGFVEDVQRRLSSARTSGVQVCGAILRDRTAVEARPGMLTA
jgi:hypothetical protein